MGMWGQTETARQRDSGRERDGDSRRQADAAFSLPRWRYMICNISKHTSQQQRQEQHVHKWNPVRLPTARRARHVYF